MRAFKGHTQYKSRSYRHTATERLLVPFKVVGTYNARPSPELLLLIQTTAYWLFGFYSHGCI